MIVIDEGTAKGRGEGNGRQHSGDRTALMWQWSGGGGTRNGYGDFDQIDGARTP